MSEKTPIPETKTKAFDKLKDEFLRNISHELRTPLTTARGYLDLLNKDYCGPLSDKQKKYIQVSLQNLDSLNRHINNLLDLTLIKSHAIELFPEPIMLNEIFEKLHFYYNPLAEVQNLSLDVQNNFKNVSITTDPTRLYQILSNLLSNALKFSHEGTVSLSVETAPESHILFKVKDSGIGLATKDLDAIFDAFRQLDASESREYNGLGVGLAIVHSLVTLLKGSVDIKSCVGEGSTFIVTLPSGT
jgi:signal transduction histidine kinase